MKKNILTAIAMAFSLAAMAQKPPIDLGVSGKWSEASSQLSDDGNYVINHIPAGSDNRAELQLIAVHSAWKLSINISGYDRGSFTADSKRVVFKNNADSLAILELGKSRIDYIPKVASFQLSKEKTGEWIAYQLTGKPKELLLKNLENGTSLMIDSLIGYQFSDNGKVLLAQVRSSAGNTGAVDLKWVSLPEATVTTIWHGEKPGNVVFDQEAAQLAFSQDNGGAHSYWYYRAGTASAAELINDRSDGVPAGLHLESLERFSKDGSRLFFYLNQKPASAPPADAVKVNVWSYLDPKLQSMQLYELNHKDPFDNSGPGKYAAVVSINNHAVVQLEQDGDKIIRFGGRDLKDNYVLVTHSNGGAANEEWNWNRTARTSLYLISTNNGARKRLITNYINCFYNLGGAVLSPQGKYVIFYNPQHKNYCSYETSTGRVRNITSGINASWTTYDRDDEPVSNYEPIGLAGWIEGDKSVLIYDQNDIWKIDPQGKRAPVNLTNSYGRRHHIVFQPISYSPAGFPADAKLILNALNRDTKDNGFFKIDLTKSGDPQLLVMQPYLYGGINGTDEPIGQSIAKAQNADVYLLQRQSAAEFPNSFLTTDFKHFTQLTNLQPQKAYNWMTSQLITWKTLDGTVSRGILYKPENFDPDKKYPVIFTYYERGSEALNQFQHPELCYGPIAPSLSFYVSNGYLVFIPDIHSKVGHPGEAAVNSIVSAAKYLAKLPFVDGKHMGLEGQSFGGFETDFVVTHSNVFAAACSTSGMTDFVSAYGSLIGGGTVRQMQYELYRDRIGASLWERPDLYIENSPVFKADKVTTPLLMMANKEDDDVPWQQGIEFFTALRRLGKKAWMLQYDGEGHMLIDDKNEKDLTIRMKQFFDHYLKGAPAPKWMTHGIPAAMKGTDTGYELDEEIKTPGPGLLIENTTDLNLIKPKAVTK